MHAALLVLENAVLVPSLGSATAQARTAMASLAAHNAVAAVTGRPVLTPVNGDGLGTITAAANSWL